VRRGLSPRRTRIQEALTAIPLARALDRGAIRRRFEERFSVARMARDYLKLYQQLSGSGAAAAAGAA
jgi:glycosyltransferase involved in cell wall biosynthesis